MVTPGGFDPERPDMVTSALTRVLADWTSMVQSVDRLRRQLETIHAEVGHLRRELAYRSGDGQRLAEVAGRQSDLHERVAELDTRLSGFDERLSNVLAQVDAATGVRGQSAADMAHHDRVKDYRAFLEQDLGNLLVEVGRSGAGLGPRERAVLAARVCQWLFQDPEIDDARVAEEVRSSIRAPLTDQLAQRAAQVCDRARDLRRSIPPGRAHRWEFAYVPDTRPIEGRQEPCVGSAENGVVRFVVSPAYVVDGDLWLSPQSVFVTEWEDED